MATMIQKSSVPENPRSVSQALTADTGRQGRGPGRACASQLSGAAPAFASFADLERRCLDRLGDRLRGHAESIGERLERDLAALQPRLATPFDACDRRPARVSSPSLVRYERNDYAVPTAHGHRRPVQRRIVADPKALVLDDGPGRFMLRARRSCAPRRRRATSGNSVSSSTSTEVDQETGGMGRASM